MYEAVLDDTRPTAFLFFFFPSLLKKEHAKGKTPYGMSRQRHLRLSPTSRQGAQCCSVWFSFGVFFLNSFLFCLFDVSFCGNFLFLHVFLFSSLLLPLFIFFMNPRKPCEDLTVCCPFRTKLQRPSACEVDKVRVSF